MKKLLALLLAAALLMTLSVSVVADEVLLPATGTFESSEVGTAFSGTYIAGEWSFYRTSETAGSAQVVASGSEEFGNCVKVETAAGITQFGCQLSGTRTNNSTDFRFAIKFDDMNETRTVGAIHEKASFINKLLSFNTDGTISVCGKVMDNFKYETGKWYNVSYLFTYHNYVKVTIEDESGNKYSDVGCYGGSDSLYQRVFIETTPTNGGGVYYVDNLSIVEGGLIRLKAESFDKIAINTSLNGQDGGSSSRGFNYKANSGTMTVVEKAGADRALKISTDTNNSYSRIMGWDANSTPYANAILEFDLKFADKNLPRNIAAYIDGTAVNVLIFNADGSITVGTNQINGFAYESGENAPWYKVKVYVSAATGAVKAVISDGKNMSEFWGSIATTGTHVTNMQLVTFVASGFEASTTYVDNIKLREFFPKNADFYTKTSNFSFDNVTALPTGHLTDGYSNFTLHHNNTGTGTVAGATVNIDGRKALQASRISGSTNTTLRWFEMDEIDSAANTLEFDLMLDENNVKKAGAIISCESAGITFNNDGEIVCSGETLGNYNYGDWYRISISFDFAGKKYDLKIVNLDSKQSFTKTVNLAEDSTLSQIKLMYILANLDAGDKFYVDNVRLGRSGALYSMDQTWYEEGVAPHLGATILFNHNIDPTNQNNEIVLNGVRYTGAEANKFIDARYMGCASLTGLDGDTTYDVEYKLYDMFGNYAEGKTTISTCEKYTFGDITLSAETLVAGDITASLTGKISCDETANLIFALYEKGAQRMCSVKMVNISYSDASANYTATLTVPDDNKEYEVRAFLWDKNLSPLAVTPVGLSQ